MALRGNLRDLNLTQLLNLVSLAKKTGALTLVEGESRATLYFRQGMLIHLSLDGQASNLRNLLERAGKIGKVESLLLPQEARSDKEWALLLINTGLINRADIVEAVRRHTLEMVYRLFAWTEGSFLFESNILLPDDKITVSLHIDNVILGGSRWVEERKRLEEELPDLGMALNLTYPRVRLKGVNLSLDEWKVVASIDHSRSIQEIAQTHSLTDFQIRKIIYGLLSAGLVELAPRVKPEVSAAPSPEVRAAPLPVSKAIILRLINRIRRL